jgi:two-component system response regulator MprA
VLVAEDTLEVRDLLVEVLIAEGYSVVTATDGIEALEAMRHYHVDVLLLDLMMPRLDGWKILQRLMAELGQHAPRVIVVSAAHDMLGAQNHPLVEATVCKPFDLDHLLALVDNLAHRPAAVASQASHPHAGGEVRRARPQQSR